MKKAIKRIQETYLKLQRQWRRHINNSLISDWNIVFSLILPIGLPKASASASASLFFINFPKMINRHFEYGLSYSRKRQREN